MAVRWSTLHKSQKIERGFMASESFSPVEETDLEEDDEYMSLYCLETKLEDDDVLQNFPLQSQNFLLWRFRVSILTHFH